MHCEEIVAWHVYARHLPQGREKCFCGKPLGQSEYVDLGSEILARHLAEEGGLERHYLEYLMGVERD